MGSKVGKGEEILYLRNSSASVYLKLRRGRTASWQQGSKRRGITRSSRRAQLIKVFFFRFKVLKCSYSFLEGLSMLTITSIKTSLKQTFMKKSCSCSVYALTARRPVCWFDALQPVTQIVTFYAILEIISVHILTQFLFAFIENMYFLPNN